jgi:hypothetical protein
VESSWLNTDLSIGSTGMEGMNEVLGQNLAQMRPSRTERNPATSTALNTKELVSQLTKFNVTKEETSIS